MTNEQRNEIRARADAATPGPWRVNERIVFEGQTMRVHENLFLDSHGSVVSALDCNIEFIAHARQDIPALLDALEEVNKRNEPREIVTETHDMKPMDKHELEFPVSITHYKCPGCLCVLSQKRRSCLKKYDDKLAIWKPAYCVDCGQRLDWSRCDD